ncbi:unnamed protein product [Adineta ricciae]|uniref:Uncharacterized protein n=1 Tax=Adineta ricciae TaxID=249248 RepID=A0A815MWA6_ADIRI|nr:unnamed protein product [Adineta ricciae]CAF1428818.1 unnamed protein product [Adineta ricciae]
MAIGMHAATAEVIAYDDATKPIKIVYDTWTPRPHFIIVQREQKKDATDTELQATFEIVGQFLSENRQFVDQAILSFHRGSWYQENTSKWHAHICVPLAPYLQQARNQIRNIPNNRQWQGAQSAEQGITNLHKKNMRKYQNYKNDCIQKPIPNSTPVESIALSRFNPNTNEFRLVWLASTPRIGVVAQAPAQTKLASLYRFMSDTRVAMERALSQVDPSFGNFGCHFCLYVRDQTDTFTTCRPDQILTANGEISVDPNIVGYIQMDENQYAQWLPSNVRQKWLGEFSRAEHFVRT